MSESHEEIDPKEQMRQALEAKKKATHHQSGREDNRSTVLGDPRGKAAGKRQFRRKSGG